MLKYITCMNDHHMWYTGVIRPNQSALVTKYIFTYIKETKEEEEATF